MPQDLVNINELSQHQSKLEALGYTTLEQLTGAAQVSRPELSAYLGVDVSQLLDQLPVSASSIPASALNIIATSEYPLGVALDYIPYPATAPSIPLAGAPAGAAANVNLIPTMPAIRDQGDRGTCVAHAALAVYEQFLHTNGATHDLSEQFLYWNCKRNDGIPTLEGTWLGVAFPLLKRDGCCLENTWQYNPAIVQHNEGQGPPPSGAQLEALTFRISLSKQIASTSVKDIKNQLTSGRCVAFSIPVFNSWYRNSYVALTGDIVMPIPGEVRVGGHAMCMVGYEDLPNRPEIGGGQFIIRNSWDKRWGIQSPFGAGYGTIPYDYIARFCSEAYSVD